jgi:hypothetical protein
MKASYNDLSPWSQTPIVGNHLSFLAIRSVSSEKDDYLYTIEPKFAYRPDLLAYALYGTPELWWVFAQRNMDVLQDPIFDFTAGTQIYLCKKSSLTKVLGL